MNPAHLTHFKRFWHTIADILFPISCLGCGVSGASLCKACALRVRINTRHFCFYCRKRAPLGVTHPACRAYTVLDGISVATAWPDSLIRHAVHLLKYQGVVSLTDPLAQCMKRALISHPVLSRMIESSDTRIIPVPLHPKKKRTRGFNQSELLAGALVPAERILSDAIFRRFNSPSSASLSRRNARIERSRGIYALAPHRLPLITGHDIILIDDVVTSGSTLSEIARLAHAARAKHIWAFTLAHG